jgi:hypothetical protein
MEDVLISVFFGLAVGAVHALTQINRKLGRILDKLDGVEPSTAREPSATPLPRS